jgi:hypothetical protein
MNCPKCNSTEIVKNGRTHYAKQRFRCQECRRQFVENPSRQPIDAVTRSLIDKLLLERLALAAIARGRAGIGYCQLRGTSAKLSTIVSGK